MMLELNDPLAKLAEELENHKLDEEVARIRKCLLENKDDEGAELETIDIELTDEAKDFWNEYCEKYNITLNEAIWLVLEKVIDSKTTTE